MSLPTPETVQKLQMALHVKAKRSPELRFYALYDKIYRADVLRHAYDRCRSNRGAAGVDGQTFDEIESAGVEAWLGVLTERLRKKTYRPDAVRRVMISKATGGERPLGIPTTADRVVQMAAVLHPSSAGGIGGLPRLHHWPLLFVEAKQIPPWNLALANAGAACAQASP